jgi:hypothetical protein
MRIHCFPTTSVVDERFLRRHFEEYGVVKDVIREMDFFIVSVAMSPKSFRKFEGKFEPGGFVSSHGERFSVGLKEIERFKKSLQPVDEAEVQETEECEGERSRVVKAAEEKYVLSCPTSLALLLNPPIMSHFFFFQRQTSAHSRSMNEYIGAVKEFMVSKSTFPPTRKDLHQLLQHNRSIPPPACTDDLTSGNHKTEHIIQSLTDFLDERKRKA